MHIFFYWHTSLKITIWFHCETFCLETFLTRRKLKIPFFMTNSEGFWLINSLLLCASVIIFHFSLIHLSQHICTRQKILPDFMLYEVIISKNCRLMLALKSPISTLYLEVILTHKFWRNTSRFEANSHSISCRNLKSPSVSFWIFFYYQLLNHYQFPCKTKIQFWRKLEKLLHHWSGKTNHLRYTHLTFQN